MANVFNTNKDAPGIIAKAAAKMLENEMHFCKSIARADESDYDGKNGYSAGNTIYINKPPRFTPQSTFDITSSKQDIVEEKTPLTLDIISTIGLGTDSLEFAHEIQLKNYINRVVKPAVSRIAQDVEVKMLEKATDAVWNSVGNAGSNTFDPATVLAARARLTKGTTPIDDNRYLLLDSTAMGDAVNARKGPFQSADEVGKQYKMGYVGQADGFRWMESELLNSHTNGNDVVFEVRTTVTAQGATQIVVEGLTTTTGTVTKGTVFTVAGVYAVNPITKVQQEHLQQFVVLSNVTADGSGFATLDVSPAMYTTGNLKNISGFPTDGNAIVPVGSASTAYTQGLAYHRDAFRMVSVPLVMPKNAELAAQETVNGITIAIIRDFDVNTREMITRLDFLGGLCADRPEFATRLPR